MASVYGLGIVWFREVCARLCAVSARGVRVCIGCVRMARKVQGREVGRAGAGWGREGRTSCMMRVSSSSVHPSLHTDGQS